MVIEPVHCGFSSILKVRFFGTPCIIIFIILMMTGNTIIFIIMISATIIALFLMITTSTELEGAIRGNACGGKETQTPTSPGNFFNFEQSFPVFPVLLSGPKPSQLPWYLLKV